ncbi:hypothetical protein EI94DRAFT_1699967 [Lactarius quietus]|nr:hypothetical protein EI94DRAFT_1699967 [Lactarius quietus]
MSGVVKSDNGRYFEVPKICTRPMGSAVVGQLMSFPSDMRPETLCQTDKLYVTCDGHLPGAYTRDFPLAQNRTIRVTGRVLQTRGIFSLIGRPKGIEWAQRVGRTYNGAWASDQMQVTGRCSEGQRSNSDEKGDEDGGWRQDKPSQAWVLGVVTGLEA